MSGDVLLELRYALLKALKVSYEHSVVVRGTKITWTGVTTEPGAKPTRQNTLCSYTGDSLALTVLVQGEEYVFLYQPGKAVCLVKPMVKTLPDWIALSLYELFMVCLNKQTTDEAKKIITKHFDKNTQSFLKNMVIINVRREFEFDAYKKTIWQDKPADFSSLVCVAMDILEDVFSVIPDTALEAAYAVRVQIYQKLVIEVNELNQELLVTCYDKNNYQPIRALLSDTLYAWIKEYVLA